MSTFFTESKQLVSFITVNHMKILRNLFLVQFVQDGVKDGRPEKSLRSASNGT